MDAITLIWQGSHDDHPLGEYREKIIIPYGSLKEATVAWEKLCAEILTPKNKPG